MNLFYLAGAIGTVVLLVIVGGGFLALRKKETDGQGNSRPNREPPKGNALSSDFVLNAIEDGIIMVDPKNIIKFFNASAAKITGWPVQEAVGLDFHSVINIVDAHGSPYLPQNHPFFRAMRGTSTIRENSGMLSTRTGRLVPVSIMVSPVGQNSGPEAGSVVAVMRDISQEKEEERRQSDFISTASHEMRTPIAAIEGYLALVLNPKVSTVDERARKYLEKAHSSTQHLAQLFQDLLTSSKAEDGRIASYPTVVELGEVLEQIADGGRFNAQKKGLELKYQVSSNKEITGGTIVRPLFYIYADPNRVREVLQNIVDNAIKYTLQGSVTISLTGNESIVQVQVSDTGQGIPEEDIPHLFQKFYRVDNSMTRSVGGTGLGLYISKYIVEMYNGRIWVESQLGKGSTFFISLPRLTTQQAQEMLKLSQLSRNPLEAAHKI